MRYVVTSALLILFSVSLAIAGTIKGIVKDADTQEPLIGANIVVLGTSLGSTTDEDGSFVILNVPEGEYKIEISYLGYQQVEKMVTVGTEDVTLTVELTPVALTADAITIVANRARFRETPVAFTDLEKEEIVKTLGSRDVPLVLNTTPGIYATEQGGGAGDSRINVRGFDQRNVAVTINGVPVNDMENGWVYWSNWDGLGDVTSSIQVQRGLGATNLAIASVGGTLNILTDAAAAKPGILYKQEYGSANFLKETFTASTGLLDNGLAATVAVVRKTGRGIVDQTWTDAWAYFGALSWTVNKSHRFDLFAIGAPQKHGQRLYTSSIATYDAEYARKIYEEDNLPEETIAALDNAPNYGRNFNPNWGPIMNYDPNDLKEYYNGSVHDFSNRTIYMDGEEVSGASVLMERENYYHKPQFNLNWYWNISKNFLLTNVAYLSIGRGGGTGRLGSRFGKISDGPFAGQIDWQSVYDKNSTTLAQDADSALVADGLVGATERKASTAIRNSVNKHFWYGLLTTAEYRMGRNLKFTFGFDGRYYKGEHYREVRNLLGGDYILDYGDDNQTSPVKRLGDKVVYHNDGFTRWIGGFLQVEGKKGPLTAFVSGSVSQTSYKRIDYFVDKNAYKQPGSRILPPESDWQNFLGGTIKVGANYNLTQELNLYTNIGFFSKAPIFDAVFDFSHQLYAQTYNEKVYALEIGSGYRTGNFYSNINFYYTRWDDRTWSRSVTTATGTPIYFLLQGIDARHTGVELDWTYKASRWIEFRSALSVGDWIWLNDVETTYAPEDDPTNLTTFNVYANGLKVGDAAQKTFSISTTIHPVKDSYLNATLTTFGDHFADFDPARRTDPNDRTQPWLVPNYTLVDLHFGYTLPVTLGTVKLELFGHVFNLFDEKYITDADDGRDHSAATARVFIGIQRKFNVGLKVNL